MICVDASVAIKWLLKEERSDRAVALYDATATANQPIVAPALLPLEVTNILRQRMRGQDGISLIRATEHLAAFLAFPIEFHNPAGLHHRRSCSPMLSVCRRPTTPTTWRWPSDLGCEVWTDDQRLLRQVAESLPFVRWIGDHPATVEG